ncbi:NAD(P)/FAD-dependent oxidoreductase [Paenibacillus sp. IB182496]|uniref:Ferredoxin--NADP reductase n=1 Tax=Paenibacillus sabuli TaxID=2772509 RepID=A0A927GQH3_9BACL|nr:NAD(P)/FAD-dependent oxidoreductase [Paenibacillus sabuli]MBD2844383.1 NAD(P)/FAD-dependent oxidoreductase [Paenibacillus sabuli]
MSEDIYDLTIIGGGPAGMYAAFYSGIRAMKTKLIEAKPQLGGFMWRYPEKMVWDVGAVGPTRCESLIHALEKQARTFDPTVVLGQEINDLTRREDGVLIVRSNCGAVHYTRTVLLCAGRGITELEKLRLEGEPQQDWNNLYYTVNDCAVFAGKHVLVSGGGNAAVDWANDLHDHGAHVTIVHRRTQFDALERNIERLYEHAAILTPYALHQLQGQNDDITHVSLSHSENGSMQQFTVDAVLINHGYKRNYDALQAWGLHMGDYGIIVNESMHTGIPGVFGAGDCVSYGSKVRLIAGAFNDAVLGVNSAMRYIDPNATKMAGVSSHHERFRERNLQLRSLS